MSSHFRPPPDLDRFKGQRPSVFLRALVVWLADLVRWLQSKNVLPLVVPMKTGGSGIAARSGVVPGSAACNVVTWDGTDLSVETETETVRNLYGTAFDSDTYIWCARWLGEMWALAHLPGGEGGGPAPLGRCECPEETYEVEINQCGSCYDEMPKYWWVDIKEVYGNHEGGTPCTGTPCLDAILKNQRIRLVNVPDPITGVGTCEWLGQNGSCLFAQLVNQPESDRWRLRIYDKNDCIVFEDFVADADFECCGHNVFDTSDLVLTSGACDLVVHLDADPCTCCESVICPPPGEPICADSPCCVASLCSVWIGLFSLGTNSEAPAINDCVSMNGVFYLDWVGGCTWEYRAEHPLPNTVHVERITLVLSGLTWRLEAQGGSGQIAVFENDEDWDCVMYTPDAQVELQFRDAESTCPAEWGSWAIIYLGT